MTWLNFISVPSSCQTYLGIKSLIWSMTKFWDFIKNWNFKRSVHSDMYLDQTQTFDITFQNDTWKPLCHWLVLSDSIFDWLRASSRKHQFENPPKSYCMTHTRTECMLKYQINLKHEFETKIAWYTWYLVHQSSAIFTSPCQSWSDLINRTINFSCKKP